MMNYDTCVDYDGGEENLDSGNDARRLSLEAPGEEPDKNFYRAGLMIEIE